MMPKVSDSSGSNLDLEENRNATLWRRVEVQDLVNMTGYAVFVRLMPRDLPVIDVTDIVVVDAPTPPATPYFDFRFDTTGLPKKTPYVVGWTDPAGFVEIVMYGNVVLV